MYRKISTLFGKNGLFAYLHNMNTIQDINLVPFLLKGDRSTCSQICHEYLKHEQSIEKLYETVLKPSLYEIGFLWEQNKISVAKEHIATAIAESILNELYPHILSKKKIPKKILLTTAENEEHQVGIKMVSDMFEMRGWETNFVGSGVPFHDLIDFIQEYKPNVVAISLSIHFNYPGFLKMIEGIHKTFPDIKILAGGQAFSRLDKSISKYSDMYTTVSNLKDLDEFIKNCN